jgi:hypothetical protein
VLEKRLFMWCLEHCGCFFGVLESLIVAGKQQMGEPEVHESNAESGGHICPSTSILYLWNSLMSIDEIWYLRRSTPVVLNLILTVCR